MGYWISLNFNEIFFNSLIVSESEFQNSNVGGKKHENLCRCRIWNKFDISKVQIHAFEKKDEGVEEANHHLPIQTLPLHAIAHVWLPGSKNDILFSWIGMALQLEMDVQ